MKKLESYTPQRKNANKHTQRGMGLLANSLQNYGIADGITVAADGESISGAARLEKLAEIMPDVKIVEVETDGNTLLVNKRIDIPSADDPRAKALSIAANRVAQVDLEWDTDVLKEWTDVKLDEFWKADELERMGTQAPIFKEYDESIADGVEVCKCPTCGHTHAKKD